MRAPALRDTGFDEIVCANLTLPGLREDSVKITQGGVAEGRYLLSFSRRALLPGPKGRLERIATGLGVTDIARLLTYVSAANAVHFGFEPDGPSHKIYLEFPPPRRPEPDLVFLALKAGRHGAPVNRYLDRMHLDASQKQDLLSAIIPDPTVHATATACLEAAGALLEVVEDGSPRRSLDFNLADSGWRLGDLPGLDDLLARFGVPGALAQDRDAPLGHFAAGHGRDGQPFITLYIRGGPME